MTDKKIELKLTPLDEKASIKSLPDLTDLTRSLMMKFRKDSTIPYFGSIRSLFDSEAFRYKIIEFYPHATEVDRRKRAYYQTTQQALDACVAFLKDKGYHAERIDLESILSRAGTRRETF